MATKLGQQTGRKKAREARAGKLGQQVGAKPTQAAVKRRKEAREKAKKEAERKKKELKKSREEFDAKSIPEYKKQYNQLPSWQKKYFTSPEKLQQKQDQIISKVDKSIERAQREYSEAKQERKETDEDDEEDRLDRYIEQYRAELKAYKKSKRQLQQGKFIEYKEITDFAARSGVAALNEEKARQSRLEQKREFKSEFEETTGIDYDTAMRTFSPGAKADLFARYRAKQKGISKEKAIEQLKEEGVISVKKTEVPVEVPAEFQPPKEGHPLLPSVPTKTTKQIPVSEVQPYEPTGIEKGEATLRKFGDIGTPQSGLAGSGKKALAYAGLSALGTARFFTSLGKDIIGGKGGGLPIVPEKTISGLGKGAYSFGKGFFTGKKYPEAGRILSQEPAGAIGYVGSEIGQSFIGGGILKAGSKGARLGITRISPGYRKFEDISQVPTSKGKIDIVGTYKGTSELSMPLKKQTEFAGKRITAVSGQKGFFDNILRRKRTIEKPKPTPDAPELERAFFADPTGQLRAKRLGVGQQERASIFDVYSGEATFKRTKPQAIVTPDTKVAEFPTGLKTVERKLKTGKTLTKAEEAKFLEFQMKPTEEFKPVGFVSTEPEVVLPPGQVLKKKGTRAVTITGGERIPVIETEIAKTSEVTKGLLGKARKGTISPTETTQLQKRLTKETGISYPTSQKPYVSPTSAVSPGISFSKFFKAREGVSVPSTTRPTRKVKSPLSVSSYGKSLSAGSLYKRPTSPILSKPSAPSPTTPVTRFSGISPPTKRKAPTRLVSRRKTPPVKEPPIKTTLEREKPRKKSEIKVPKMGSPTKVKRKPTLAAIGLSIKERKRRKGEFTGMGIRPILKKSKSKKKKSKKKSKSIFGRSGQL